MKKRITGGWMARAVLACLVLVACAVAAPAQEITVAAASDLSFALKDVAARFEAKTGTKVKLTFGSSGNFFNSIRNGAPYDVFFSADSEYPSQLQSAGLTDGAPQEYATGRIVLWTPKNSAIDLQRGWAALDSARKIAIANPQHAPYGRAAVEAMKSAGVYERARSKLVMGENISQTAQFVETGNAEVGVIALALAMAPTMQGKYWTIPQDSYSPMRQSVVILNTSRQKGSARKFLEYLKSEEAQRMLKKYGF